MPTSWGLGAGAESFQLHNSNGNAQFRSAQPEVELINDFLANGYGCLCLGPSDICTIQEGMPVLGTSCSVCESRDLFFLYFRVPEIPIFWEKSAEFRGIIAP